MHELKLDRWFGSAALIVLLSCSGEAEPPLPANFGEACEQVAGCEAATVPVAETRVAIWRVLVKRDGAGAARVEAIHEIGVSSSVGAPQGPIQGTLGLAALDASGQALELQLVNFPKERSFDYLDGTGLHYGLSDSPVSFVGYLEVNEMAATIALVESDGTLVHSIAAPAPGEAVQQEEAEGLTPGISINALTQVAPATACSHVMLLDGSEDAIWNETEFTPLRATPTQRAVIQSALGRLSPTHCMGVGRIVLVDETQHRLETGGSNTRGGWVATTSGDLVGINVGVLAGDLTLDEHGLQDPHAQALLVGVIAHEAAHSLTYLLASLADDGQPFQGIAFEGAWAPTERSLAAQTIERVRLGRDFPTLWNEMHESFVDLGWADTYCSEDIPDLCVLDLASAVTEACTEAGKLCAGLIRDRSVDATTENGFMSHYSGLDVFEDIADFAAWPVIGPLYEAAGVPVGPGADNRGYGCIAMNAYAEENVPSRLSAVFTKLTFLRDLGVVTEENYQRCLGESLRLGDDPEGFTIYEDGEIQNSFGNAPEAGIGTRDGRYVFTFEARGSVEVGGEAFSAVLTLEIDLGPTTDQDGASIPVDYISWPRGAFRISPLSPHALRLRIADSPAANFDVTDGFILAAEGSNQRIGGSVFVTQAFRYMSPFPVPQVFDPPLSFRFNLEN